MNTSTMIALFWVAMACLTTAAAMGIASIWVEDMWVRYSWSWKLWQTSLVLSGTSLVLAIVVWLFRWFLQ